LGVALFLELLDLIRPTAALLLEFFPFACQGELQPFSIAFQSPNAIVKSINVLTPCINKKAIKGSARARRRSTAQTVGILLISLNSQVPLLFQFLVGAREW
jgi:hypothetical protein